MSNATLSLLCGRRVGFHTPYGWLVAIFGLGYWLTFTSFVSYAVPTAFGLPQRRELGLDVFDLVAWTLPVIGLGVLVARFSGPRSPLKWRLGIAACIALPTVALGYGLLANAPLDRVGVTFAVVYVLLDGIVIGLAAVSVFGSMRARNTSFGRLYLMLCFALAFKGVGDMLWFGGYRDAAQITFVPAVILALIGWSSHYLAIRRAPRGADSFADPQLVPEQRILRDAARELRGIAGHEAGHLVLASAGAALARHGVAHWIHDDIVDAVAPAPVWQSVLADVAASVEAELGPRAKERLLDIRQTFLPTTSLAAWGTAR